MSTHFSTEDYQCDKCNSTNSIREIIQDTKSYDNFYEICFDCGHLKYLVEKTETNSLKEINVVRDFYDLEELTQEQLDKNRYKIIESEMN